MPALDFKGKQFVYAHHLSVPYRTLEVDAKKSVLAKDEKGEKGAEADGNLIIHGDNLEALKALLPRYGGRVNCIYIDPPYNTGNEGWCYNDNVNAPLMKRWLKDNGEVDREDMERHDKWLCMMWPRLQLLRELLAEDGVIFISIDDNEQHRLRLLMDEVFGEENFVAQIVVKSNPGGRDYGGIAQTHDYVVVYGKGEKSELNIIEIDNATMPLSDKIGGFELRELRNRNVRFNIDNRPNLYYPFYANPKKSDDEMHDVSLSKKRGWVEVYPMESNGIKTVWRWGKEKSEKNININIRSKRKRDGEFQIVEKFRRVGIRERSLFVDSIYRNEQGTLSIKAIFSERAVFDYPKSDCLIKKIVELGSGHDSIILDSFAGSGTTAQAVLELNKADGGNRKFILVECEEYADKITAERVRRVIKGVPKAKDANLKKGLGGTFAFCTLGAPMDLENLLSGKKLPDYDSLARYIAHTAAGVSLPKIAKGKDWFFGESTQFRMHLIYQPDKKFLASKESALTGELAEGISKSAGKGKAAKTILVFAPWKFMSQKELTSHGITFCQLPYAIHRLYGDEMEAV